MPGAEIFFIIFWVHQHTSRGTDQVAPLVRNQSMHGGTPYSAPTLHTAAPSKPFKMNSGIRTFCGSGVSLRMDQDQYYGSGTSVWTVGTCGWFPSCQKEAVVGWNFKPPSLAFPKKDGRSPKMAPDFKEPTFALFSRSLRSSSMH